jgi:membrane protein implicated in regulation of membrane protease activity
MAVGMFYISLMTFTEWFIFSSILYALAYITRLRFFYWLALSGLIVGSLLLVGSFSWELQWSTFFELSMFLSLLGWHYAYLEYPKTSDGLPPISVGELLEMERDFPEGKSPIIMQEIDYFLCTAEDLKVGEVVEISAIEGNELHVKKTM